MDDVISRKKTIKHLASVDWRNGRGNVIPYERRIKIAYAIIIGVPSEQKTANWIKKPVKQYCSADCWYPPSDHEDTWNEVEGSWLESEYFCSNCGFQPSYAKEEPWYKYCPDCGRRMVKNDTAD